MIGVFDSGIGGLTVVKEIFQQLPDYPIVYFGDTDRSPYGNKSSESIKQHALEDSELLIRRGATIIVIACNTASAVSAEYLKKKLKVPVFEVISPAILAAEKETENNKVGVMGTRATVNSKVYKKEFQAQGKEYEVYSQAAPLLVPLIEEKWLKREETMMILKHYLVLFKKKDVDTLILACTHYPVLRDAIARHLGSQVSLVDPARETVMQLKQWLGNNQKEATKAREGEGEKYYVSDITPHFKDVAENLLGRRIKLELADVTK